MDIKRAKKEIRDSIEAYLAKDEYGDYMIPSIRQRPILLMGPPGIGKTQVMEQVAKECNRQLYGKEVGNPSGGVFSTFRFLAGEFLGNSRHKGVRQRGKRTFGVQKTQQTQRGRQRGIRQSVHHS